MDFANTLTLLDAVKQMAPTRSFLRDRYFPTNDATDVFNTSEVIVEYKDGNKKLAPFVSPRKNGMTMLRDGYAIKGYSPANIAPRRPLYIDDLNKKGFGEALFSNLTPAARQMALVTMDLMELDEAITRREEAMAAEVMLTNGCVMKHYADKNDEYLEKEIHFYDGVSNPAIYTPTNLWSTTDADILGDLAAMIRMLTTKGCDATEIIVGTDVANAIIDNAKIQKLLDIRRYEMGVVAPQELPTGAALLASFPVMGHNINVLTYDATYEDENGNTVSYIPANKVIMTAPGAGRTAYGCVTQVEQTDGEMHSYAGKRVPHYVSDAANNSRSLTLTAAPLVMPKRKNCFISATVLS